MNMTRQEANKLSKEELKQAFVPEWIGQGYGYKSLKDWGDMEYDEIIYIPEYGYDEDDNPEHLYTKGDFIELCNGAVDEEGETIHPQFLFEMVDWQSPEALFYEIAV